MTCVIVARRSSGNSVSVRKTSELLWQDAQHQVLFELLDLLREPASGDDVLHRLRDYTETHFTLEEHYRGALDFPGTAAHGRAHRKFRLHIDSLLDKNSPGELFHDDSVRQAVATYLTEWLKLHVFGIDKELEAFILASPAK